MVGGSKVMLPVRYFAKNRHGSQLLWATTSAEVANLERKVKTIILERTSIAGSMMAVLMGTSAAGWDV